MNSNSRRKQKGLAAVEAVIVLPLLVFLALAIGEFGHALMLYTTLNKAQQDGARYLSNVAIFGQTGIICLGEHPSCTADDIGNVSETKNLVVYGNLARGGEGDKLLEGLSVDDVVVSTPDELHIRVRVTYNFTPVFGDVLSNFGFPLTYDLVSTVTMRAL